MNQRKRHDSDVVVLDAERKFVSYVPVAVARRLLGEHRARVLRKSPFAIILPPGVTEVPEVTWSAKRSTAVDNKSTPENANVIPAKQPPKSPQQIQSEASARLNRRQIGYSFAEYFKERTESDAVYIQNISDKQISLDIDVGMGQSQSKLIPPTPDPIDLTSDGFTFDVLKKSSRFRQALAKRREGRPELILLDAAQVEAYYIAKAKQIGAFHADGTPDIEAAMDHAEWVRRKMTTREVDGENISPNQQQNFAPPKTAQELISMELATRGVFAAEGQLQSTRMQAGAPMMGQGQIAMTEVVSPRILHLCQQVSPQLPPNQRMAESQFMAALQTFHNLSLEDLQHIEAHGTYRQAKRFARERIAKVAQSDDGIEGDLSLAGKQLVGMAQRQGAMQTLPQSYGAQGPVPIAQQGVQYQGPTGFANAAFQEAYGAGQAMTSPVLGPDGNPLG